MMDEEDFRKLKSHKGGKLRKHTVREKLTVVSSAASTSNRAAAARFKVDEHSVRLWRKQKDDLAKIEKQGFIQVTKVK